MWKGNDLALNRKWCLHMQQFSRASLAVIGHPNMADRPADRRSVQDFLWNVINAVTNVQTRSNQRGNNEELKIASVLSFFLKAANKNLRRVLRRGVPLSSYTCD